MTSRSTLVVAIVAALAGTLLARAGSLSPPAGPVAATSPSLADLQASLSALGGSDANAYFIEGDCLAKGGLGDPAGMKEARMVSPEIDGTDTTVGYEGAVNVLGVEEQASATGEKKPIRVLVQRDKAVGQLMQKMIDGDTIASMTIDTIVFAGGGPAVVESIELTNAMVCKITCSPTAGVAVVELKADIITKTFYQLDVDGNIIDTYIVTIDNTK